MICSQYFNVSCFCFYGLYPFSFGRKDNGVRVLIISTDFNHKRFYCHIPVRCLFFRDQIFSGIQEWQLYCSVFICFPKGPLRHLICSSSIRIQIQAAFFFNRKCSIRQKVSGFCPCFHQLYLPRVQAASVRNAFPVRFTSWTARILDPGFIIIRICAYTSFFRKKRIILNKKHIRLCITRINSFQIRKRNCQQLIGQVNICSFCKINFFLSFCIKQRHSNRWKIYLQSCFILIAKAIVIYIKCIVIRWKCAIKTVWDPFSYSRIGCLPKSDLSIFLHFSNLFSQSRDRRFFVKRYSFIFPNQQNHWLCIIWNDQIVAIRKGNCFIRGKVCIRQNGWFLQEGSCKPYGKTSVSVSSNTFCQPFCDFNRRTLQRICLQFIPKCLRNILCNLNVPKFIFSQHDSV